MVFFLNVDQPIVGAVIFFGGEGKGRGGEMRCPILYAIYHKMAMK